MRVIRIGERYSISTDEVETYDLLPVKTYVVMYNDKDGFYLTEHTNIEVREKIYGVHESKVKKVLHEERGCEWITMLTKQGVSVVDVKFEKHHLHYDMEKGAAVMLGDSLLLDYDDYEDDIKIEKSAAKYLAFVKSKRNPVHYIV